MNRLTALLGAGRPVLLDGGMGTLLQDSGLEDGAPGELWNLENPEAIRAAHTAYAEAGARVLTTNTFGGTRPRLDMHGLGDHLGEVNRRAAQIARSVADERGLLVAGDLGPTGELLAPLGTMTPEKAQAIFAEQLVALVEGGIDLVLVETLSDLGEADAALAAAREVAPHLPVAVTMSFDTNVRTMMGVRPAEAVAHLAAAGADAVGANCGRGPEEMELIAAQLVEARTGDLLLVAQSNAGLPQVVGDHFEYDATPHDLAGHAMRLSALGIDLVGACCGSTPAHIAAIGAALSPA
jgi:5-methyltetrahydrofolate--homocysteine methyltransferase